MSYSRAIGLGATLRRTSFPIRLGTFLLLIPVPSSGGDTLLMTLIPGANTPVLRSVILRRFDQLQPQEDPPLIFKPRIALSRHGPSNLMRLRLS